MVTSQSAATGACLAIDRKIPDYEALKKRLLDDSQILEAAQKTGGAMRGDNRPKGDFLTAGQERSVKAAGLKKRIPAMGLVK